MGAKNPETFFWQRGKRTPFSIRLATDDLLPSLRANSTAPSSASLRYAAHVVDPAVQTTLDMTGFREGMLGVSEKNGTPKSSILIGFSIINHPFWGTSIFWKHPVGDGRSLITVDALRIWSVCPRKRHQKSRG